ncbi:MAG: gamma-glutamyltransferase family protein, partial [Pseudorhodoplanes sp.]
RDFQAPGRSLVYATGCMVATSHPLASLTAIEILRAGGTAADAAVAAMAAACIGEPHMTGIGGDCFCLVARPGRPIWGYNGSGRTGGAMHAEALIEQGLTGIAIDSVHAVTVPGAIEAWDAILKAHGRFGFDRVLAPAIAAAEAGVPVQPRVALDWALAVQKLRKHSATAKHLLREGEAPRAGDVVRFPALAATLRTIAKGGARAFYEGEIADDIVASLSSQGGVLTAADFAAHRGEEAGPISTDYRGLEVVELPPNGQGLAALVLLNILERFEMGALAASGADRLHILIEAARLAYGMRNTNIADPAFMSEQVQALLDRGFAARLAGMIDPTKRSQFPTAIRPMGSTVLVCVVDRDRNAVAMINSLFSAFGSGIATEKTGILLHHRGSGLNLTPGHPNCIGPSKRPLHTIIPAMTRRDGRVDMTFGVMGGAYQAMGHAHLISNIVDHGMDLQTAIDWPRVFFEGEQVQAETGIDSHVIEALRARGHDVARRSMPHGGGQAIRIDWEHGVLIGASDPRKDGIALGY